MQVIKKIRGGGERKDWYLPKLCQLTALHDLKIGDWKLCLHILMFIFIVMRLIFHNVIPRTIKVPFFLRV